MNKCYCDDCEFKNECGFYACLQDGTIDDIVNCPQKEIVEFEKAKENLVNELKKPFIKFFNWLERVLSEWAGNVKKMRSL